MITGKSAHAPSFHMESLEDRRLRSATILSGGILEVRAEIVSSGVGATITVTESSGTITVKGATPSVAASVNFPASSLSRINVYGNSYDDYITVNTSKLLLVEAGKGDDYVVVPGTAGVGLSGYPHWVKGGDGNDVLQGGARGDILYGEGGADMLIGAGADDLLRGGDGNDVIYGGSGNDILYGDAGADKMYGEAGNDMFYANGDYNSDFLDGGADFDRAYYDTPHTIFSFYSVKTYQDTTTNMEEYHPD